MSWWGKVIGGTFGFVMGGPLGAVLGAAVGNYFDNGLDGVGSVPLGGPRSNERTQTAFFTAVFSLMGYVAKADGNVTRDEISLAEQVMGQMQLQSAQRKIAINLFDQGKKDDFPFQAVMTQFKRECGRSRNLIQMFLEILTATALADGKMEANERRILESIALSLGWSKPVFDQLVMRLSAQFRFQGDTAAPADRLKDAYKVLGVSSNADVAEIKRAYRKLMSQHHPDKLVSKGLPEEMMEMAKKKTQEIKAAYDTISDSRGS